MPPVSREKVTVCGDGCERSDVEGRAEVDDNTIVVRVEYEPP